MSRIGKKPVEIPSGVEVKIEEGNLVTVKGPKGSLTQQLHRDMIIKIEDGKVVVERPTESKFHKSLHGLTRTLIANMIKGVTEGFSKTLEVHGIGYRAELKGNTLNLQLGFSHPVEFPLPEGISAEVTRERQMTKIVIKGIDKQRVGQVAADIRRLRPPEPYKGKGIRYEGEYIRRKAGKAAA